MQTINKSYTKFWVLLALAVLFFGPAIAAWSFYETGNKAVLSTINHGHLIRPPIPLQQLHTTRPDGELLKSKQLLGKWMMLYVEPNHCDKACQTVLLKMRQVRLALGEDMPRIDRVVATFPGDNDYVLAEQIAKYYRGTRLINIDKKEFVQYLKTPAAIANFNKEGALFIVDPLGNIMMSYPVDEQPDGIYSDLKRLLKVSNIG